MTLESGIKLCKKTFSIMNQHLPDNQGDNMFNKMKIKIDN